MKTVSINYKNTLNFVSEEELLSFKDKALFAFQTLIKKTGLGNDFVGWVDMLDYVDQDELVKIIDASHKIRRENDCLVVVGIGGSYLGSKAVITALDKYFYIDKKLEIIYVGHTLSSTYTSELIEYLQDKDFAVNVISKSGTTTEPAVAFRLMKELLEKKYGDASIERIYATTDPASGALRQMAENQGYVTFNVPSDIGGRYSVLTAVGLLPIACSGVDIFELLKGASDAKKYYTHASFEENDALLYASLRNLLYEKGKKIELLVSYEPKFSFISEWWKQLFGESEGKDHLGIYPSSVVYSTDLHSLGQYVQDGERILFETIIKVNIPERDIILKSAEKDLDQINYLAGKTLNDVNNKAMEVTIFAHVDGLVPNIVLEIQQLDAYSIGYLLYFFMFSCGVSGYILGINPFKQEGVEGYKKNMFALLGKKGYEELAEDLKKRL
jgi:glucose-6-phosphate isomerase